MNDDEYPIGTVYGIPPDIWKRVNDRIREIGEIQKQAMEKKDYYLMTVLGWDAEGFHEILHLYNPYNPAPPVSELFEFEWNGWRKLLDYVPAEALVYELKRRERIERVRRRIEDLK